VILTLNRHIISHKLCADANDNVVCNLYSKEILMSSIVKELRTSKRQLTETTTFDANNNNDDDDNSYHYYNRQLSLPGNGPWSHSRPAVTPTFSVAAARRQIGAGAGPSRSKRRRSLAEPFCDQFGALDLTCVKKSSVRTTPSIGRVQRSVCHVNDSQPLDLSVHRRLTYV